MTPDTVRTVLVATHHQALCSVRIAVEIPVEELGGQCDDSIGNPLTWGAIRDDLLADAVCTCRQVGRGTVPEDR